MSFKKASLTAAVVAATLTAGAANAANWSSNEIHLQHGDLDQLDFTGAGAKETTTTIFTFQHASGWDYGSNFYFIDVAKNDSQEELTIHGEFKPKFSIGKITGADLSFGPVKDISIQTGIDFTSGNGLSERKYLPGFVFHLDAPGFAFMDFTAVATIDDSTGSISPEGDGYQLDLAYKYPHTIGGTKWSQEGHLEYMAERDRIQNGAVVGEKAAWTLWQHQVRLDVGDLIGGKADQLYAGIEYQYWDNKLGSKSDESAVQALLVWKM